MGLYPDQGDPEQIFHADGHLSKPVQKLLLHILALRGSFHPRNPLIDIQLLLLVDDVGGRNIGIHIQLHGGRKIRRAGLTLQGFHRVVQHLAVQVIPHRLHVAGLPLSEQIARAADLQIPHGDLEAASQLGKFPDGRQPFFRNLL